MGATAGDEGETGACVEASCLPRAVARPAPRSSDPLLRAVSFDKLIFLLVLPPSHPVGVAITLWNFNGKMFQSFRDSRPAACLNHIIHIDFSMGNQKTGWYGIIRWLNAPSISKSCSNRAYCVSAGVIIRRFSCVKVVRATPPCRHRG